MRRMRWQALGFVALGLGGGLSFGQSDRTNTITGNVTELWGDAAQWTGSAIPGWNLENGTGNSNDNAWVLFRAASGTVTPQLNIAGSNWVLNTLFISEDTTANRNADGNFLSRQGSTDVAGSLTLEQINYYEGGRELDFQTGVRIFDKSDGAALQIRNANTLDFWDSVSGSEGLTLGGGGTVLMRNFEVSYGSTPESGLTLDGATGSKVFLFNLGNTNEDVVHAIPNIAYVGTADPSLFFMRSLGSNAVTVSVSNITLSANRTAFRIGGQSSADGTQIATVNLEGRLEFTNVATAADRTLDIGSVHNGRVNVNGGILVHQGVDSGRTFIISGNGSVAMNSDLQAISQFNLLEAFNNTVRLDGDRNLEVVLDQQGRFGEAQRVDLRGGTVLRLNYDAFASGYPGMQLTNLAGPTSADSRAWFIDFGAVQSGFYDPYDTNQPFLVRALTGIGGNLSNAVYTGGTPNMIFETNAVIIEGAQHAPTAADIGDNVVYLGIRDAGGTNNNLGASGSIYKGAALGGSTYIGESRVYSTNGAVTDPASGFYGTLGAAAGQDLEVMVLNNTLVAPNSFSERAEFNAATGVANFRGPGNINFTADAFGAGSGFTTFGGSVTQINRIGYAQFETNLYGFHTQNSDILSLGINAIPTGVVMYVENGRVQLDHGEAIGGNGPQDNVNAALRIGSNATLLVDFNDQITRGRIITDPGAFVFVGSGADRLTARTQLTNAWDLSPDSVLILDDNGNNTIRDLADPMYELFLRSMNVVVVSNFQNYVVRAASDNLSGGDWEIGEGRRITTAGDDSASIDSIYAGTANFGIRLMDGATNMILSAAGGRTLRMNVNVTATNAWGNANLMIGDTNDFTTTAFRTGVGYRTNVNQAGTVNLYGPTNRFDSATLVAGTATLSNDVLIAGALTVTNSRTLTVAGVSNVIGIANVDGTLTVPTTAGDTLIGSLNQVAGTSTIDGSTNQIGSISALSGAVNLRGNYNTVTSIFLSGGADITIGNGASDTTRIFGDIAVEDGPGTPPNRTQVNFAQGDIRSDGNIYLNTLTGTNFDLGGASYDQVLTFYAQTSIVNGSVFIGSTNGGAGVGRVVFGDGGVGATDYTEIRGDLVLDTPGGWVNNAYNYFSRGDAIILSNVIINASGSNYTQMGRPYGHSQSVLIEADLDTNSFDGIGFYDRLRDGTLVQGPGGFVIRPYGGLRIDAPITNEIFWVGQKITVDNGGPFYSFNDRTLWLNADTNALYGFPPAAASLVPIHLTNVWMREGAHLRVNNEGTRTDARVGLILDGTNDGTVSFLGKGGSSDDIKLLDVASSSAQTRVLQVGATNSATEVFLNALLMGTAGQEVTLSAFNGRLSMTNGATVLGTAQVARDGSVFDVLPGTTGFVNRINMLAGTFSNRGDQMALSEVAVSGGQAFMGGAASYATNLNLYGGTAIVESVSLGQVTFDGGSLRADADRVLAADQGIRVTNIANGGTGIVIVDNGVTVAINNAVDGDGTLAKAGGGTLVLSNANQQAGTSVREGTLLYSADNRLRTDGAATLAVEGGVLDLNGFNQDGAGTVSFLGGLVTNGTITKTVADFDAQAGEVAATLQGTAGLTKTGPDTTVLSGSNAYQGATVIAGGSLRLNSSQALPGGVAATGGTSALVLTNGGVLGLGAEDFYRDLGTDVSNVVWAGSGGFAAYGADRHVNIGGNSATQTLTWGQANFVSGDDELVFGAIDADATVILDNGIILVGTNRFRANDGPVAVDGRIAGDLSGSGTFWKTGDGILELTGSNSYSGGTEVLGGQLVLAGANALSENSLLTISNFGVVTLGAVDFTRDLGTNGGDVIWTGSGGFAASGADRVVNLGGATGQVTWGAGFFVPDVADGGTLVLGRTGTTHTVDFQNDIDLGASNRTVFAGNGDAAIDGILSGVLSGSGGLIKTGPGTLLLNNTNQFTGGLEIQTGRLILDGGDGRVMPISLVLGSTNGDSGVLQLGGASGKSDQTLTGLAIADAGTDNRVVGGASAISTLTLDIASGENIYAGFLGGDGVNENNLALVKTNDGTLFLIGGNTYTGRTTITGGTIAIGADSALGGDPGSSIADQLILDGGTLRITNRADLIANRGITLGASGGTLESDMLPSNTDRVTINGAIGGSGGLTKTGIGTVELTQDSTYGGDTVVAGGVLLLRSANALPGGIGTSGGTSALTLTNGGVLGLGVGDFTRGLGAGDDQIQWAGDGGFAAYNGTRTVILGGGVGSTQQVTWGSGGFVPNGGKLILSAVGSTNLIVFANPIALGSGQRTIQSDDGSQTTDAQISGVISGTGGVTKTGGGGLFLSAANIFTGKTIVENGRLRIQAETGLGANPGSFTFDQLTLAGGTVRVETVSFTIDDSNRGIFLAEQGGTFEVTGSGARTLTINRPVAGPGDLTLINGSDDTLRFNVANSYTGRTILTSGILYITNENQLGSNPATFVNDQLVMGAGTLRVTNQVVINDSNRGISNTSGTASFNIDANSSLIISNVMSGPGTVAKTGAGLLALYATNTYTGNTEIREGTLALAFEEGLGDNPPTYNAGRLILTNNGALRAVESFSINDPNRGIRLDGNSAVPSTTTSGGVFEVVPDVTLDISNRITGSGVLTKIGDGTLLLNNITNDYRGGTVIAGGTLGIRAEGGLGTNAELYAGNLMISNGGILRAMASFTIDNPNKSIAIGTGGGGFEVDPTFTLTLASNIVADNLVTKYGTGRLNAYGSSNVFTGMRVENGVTVFNDSTDDQTAIIGDLVFNVDTNAQISTYHQVVRGDFSATGNIVINEGRSRPADTESSLFKLLATTNDFGPVGMVPAIDGRGLWERMWFGTLAQGADGVVVRDYARFEFAMPRTNMVFDVGQKITIDTQGPNYSGNERNLDFRAENLGAFSSGTMTFNVTNVWFEPGAYLRINEENSIVRIGAILKGDAYLSESTSGNADDFDLLDVVSDTPGGARTLQIGTINGVADTPFNTILFGTGATEVTFNVFNGTLTMTNGAHIAGIAKVSGAGSVFEAAAGTTGSVREVQVQAGDFINNGNVMAFSNVVVSGVGAALLQGGESYITNLQVSGASARAILNSPGVGFGQVTLDGGGELRAVTNYVLNAAQGVTLGEGGGAFRVAEDTTLTVSNGIGGVGGLTKFGAGTAALVGSAANTYTGLTTVSVGVLALAKDDGVNAIVGDGAASKAGADVLVNGGTLRLDQNNQMDDSVYVSVTDGNLDFNGKDEVIYNLDVSGGFVNYGLGAVTIDDPTWSGGTNMIPGNTTFGNLFISGGHNVVSNGGLLTIGTASTPGPIEFTGADNSPTLILNSDATTPGTLRFRAGTNIALNFSGTGTSSGLIASDGAGAVAGRLDLNGPDATGGTRTFDIGNAAGSPVDMTIAADIVNLTNVTAGISKTGAGTLLLSGTNSYDGETIVGAGTLLVNGDNTLANALVSVKNGAVLGGSGVIGGLAIFEAGATNAPGFLAPGVQTFANGMTFSNASVFQWELTTNASALALRGSFFDGVDVTSNSLDVVAGATMSLVFDRPDSAVNWSDAFWDSNQAWLVFDLLGTATTNGAPANFAVESNYIDSLAIDLASARPEAIFFTSYGDGGSLYLNYAVPEPSTWALLAIGSIAVAVLSRRRRRG